MRSASSALACPLLVVAACTSGVDDQGGAGAGGNAGTSVGGEASGKGGDSATAGGNGGGNASSSGGAEQGGSVGTGGSGGDDDPGGAFGAGGSDDAGASGGIVGTGGGSAGGSAQGGTVGSGGSIAGSGGTIGSGGAQGSGGAPVIGPPVGITCPAISGRPADGWPLVFAWNGNCFRSVGTGDLAGAAANAIVATGEACTAVIAHGDIQTATDLDAMIRTKVVSLIDRNRGLVNTQKIGALGFSAGGTMAAELGTRWAMGIDPGDGTNHHFRVAAIIDYYGPLRMDRSKATDATRTSTGGGGLFYLHETRSADENVDIPGIRQWNGAACYCAARGTSPCSCDDASAQYLAAYLTAYDPKANNRICSFYSDDTNLQGFSATYYVETAKPAHVAAMYFCSGARDSNVDHDQNLHQAVSWWRPEHLMTVTVPNDGHGFPYDVCETAAAAANVTPPIAWLTRTLNVPGDFPPMYR